MTHEDYKELLAASALTALDAEDARSLDLHLTSCGECRLELSEWQQTAAMIALDAAASGPSPQVRERIIAAVRAEPVEPARDTKTDSVSSKVVPFTPAQKTGWFASPSALVSIAAVLLIALMMSLFMLWQQNRSAQNEFARLSSQVEQTNRQLTRQRALISLLTSPGARMTNLAGTKEAPGARAMLAYDKSGHAMLMAKGLPEAPSGKAYQLWFIMENKKMPGKVFSTDAEGNGSLEDQIPAAAVGSAIFAITLEPESGVEAPTGEIYLLSAS